jgi:NAD(P)-dependent dehydrogenase (short-subunit alcohol dehydrogenase family)
MAVKIIWNSHEWAEALRGLPIEGPLPNRTVLVPRAAFGDLDRLFAQIKREKGKLDIVFGNAGVVKYAPFGSITEEHYDSIFSINVKGLLFTVQKALPLLPDGASIILNASIVASKGFSRNSVYNATKAARSFVRTWTLI